MLRRVPRLFSTIKNSARLSNSAMPESNRLSKSVQANKNTPQLNSKKIRTLLLAGGVTALAGYAYKHNLSINKIDGHYQNIMNQIKQAKEMWISYKESNKKEAERVTKCLKEKHHITDENEIRKIIKKFNNDQLQDLYYSSLTVEEIKLLPVKGQRDALKETKDYGVKAEDLIKATFLENNQTIKAFRDIVKRGHTAQYALEQVKDFSTYTSGFNCYAKRALRKGLTRDEILQLKGKDNWDYHKLHAALSYFESTNNKELFTLLAPLEKFTLAQSEGIIFLTLTRKLNPNRAVEIITNKTNSEVETIITGYKERQLVRDTLKLSDETLDDSHSWFTTQAHSRAFIKLVKENNDNMNNALEVLKEISTADYDATPELAVGAKLHAFLTGDLTIEQVKNMSPMHCHNYLFFKKYLTLEQISKVKINFDELGKQDLLITLLKAGEAPDACIEEINKVSNDDKCYYMSRNPQVTLENLVAEVARENEAKGTRIAKKIQFAERTRYLLFGVIDENFSSGFNQDEAMKLLPSASSSNIRCDV